MFNNLTTTGVEESKDVVGGFRSTETGLYPATVKYFYAGKAAKSNAQNVTVVLDLDGQEFSETIYVTNREGSNTYTDKQSGKQHYLPGYITADEICKITTGKGLVDQEWEEKIVKVYDPEEKKQLPKAVQCAVNVMSEDNNKLIVGIIQTIRNKQIKNGDEYVNTNDKRIEASISKVFHHTQRKTVNEFIHKVENPEFIEEWTKANKNADGTWKTQNKFQEVKNAPKQSGSSSASNTKSLFD